jgi:two-component system sensor histidine kinase KdpD
VFRSPPAALLGLLASAAAVWLFDGVLTRPAQALILVVPVVLGALTGSRRVAAGTVAAATVAFMLTLPPSGSLRIHLADDLAALVAFSAVASATGWLVARRIELLQRLEQQHASLLRSVSHDLRTPLASIQAAASELRTGPARRPESTADLLALVESEAARLDRLVGNLLSLSRIEAGALVPRRQSVDLGELVGRCTTRLGAWFPDRTVTLDLRDDVIVDADHVLLDQVVSNLVENGLRHTAGRVTVRVGTDAGGRASIAVEDEGGGVPVPARRAVFEPFRSSSGSGIGLAICAGIVRVHGGEITVSDGPGGGARFEVVLPSVVPA